MGVAVSMMSEAFLKTVGGDPTALLAVLDSAVDTPREIIAQFQVPTLVAAGIDDADNGSAPELAAVLAHGRYLELPGNHMSAVTKRQLGFGIPPALSSQMSFSLDEPDADVDFPSAISYVKQKTRDRTTPGMYTRWTFSDSEKPVNPDVI